MEDLGYLGPFLGGIVWSGPVRLGLGVEKPGFFCINLLMCILELLRIRHSYLPVSWSKVALAPRGP
jgi:hypothetical protein